MYKPLEFDHIELDFKRPRDAMMDFDHDSEVMDDSATDPPHLNCV